MSRLNQTFQNFFIRLGSALSALFGGIFGFFGKIFGSIGKLFGFSSEATYFVESQQSQNDKETTAVSSKVDDIAQTSNITSTRFSNRRPRSSDMDYFMDMAQKVKKS